MAALARRDECGNGRSFLMPVFDIAAFKMPRSLCHFDVVEWTDYARDQVSPRHCMEMQSHLREGCPSCTQHWEFLCRLAEVGVREAEYEVPADAERAAKGLFSKNRRAAGETALDVCLKRLKTHPPMAPSKAFLPHSAR